MKDSDSTKIRYFRIRLGIRRDLSEQPSYNLIRNYGHVVISQKSKYKKKKILIPQKYVIFFNFQVTIY